MPDRLAMAAKFVAALYTLSRKNPRASQGIRRVGEAAGIKDQDQLEQAVGDAERAGLLDRLPEGRVILTAEGRRVAGG